MWLKRCKLKCTTVKAIENVATYDRRTSELVEGVVRQAALSDVDRRYNPGFPLRDAHQMEHVAR
jgi:hypothetical protein